MTDDYQEEWERLDKKMDTIPQPASQGTNLYGEPSAKKPVPLVVRVVLFVFFVFLTCLFILSLLYPLSGL